MADVNKGTHFMRGVVKWASILTPNETFEPTYQATLLKPTQVNNFGEVINGDSATILADFENRGFKYSVKEDKDTDIHMIHYALTINSDCYCHCDDMCDLYNQLIELLDDNCLHKTCTSCH